MLSGVRSGRGGTRGQDEQGSSTRHFHASAPAADGAPPLAAAAGASTGGRLDAEHASYPDLVRALGANPAAGERQYLIYGRGERRALDRFDEVQYLANYPDLQRFYGSNTAGAVEHFIRYGLFEGRTDDPPDAGTAGHRVRAGRRHGCGGDRPGAASVEVATPNIDALAAAGTTYTQAYSAPACVPSRVMALSGRWPYRNSVGAVWNNGPTPPSSLVTIAERLRDVG